MKSRRNILIVLAVLAILSIGIGYAALTDTLTLTGTVKGSELTGEKEAYFDIDWISGETISNSNANVTVTPSASSSSDTAQLKIENMQIVGDKVVVAFQIKNVKCPANTKASINVTSSNSGTTNLNISTGFSTTKDGTPSGTTTTLASGETTYFIVTIESKKTLATSGDAINCTLTYTLTATAVAA